MTICVHLSTNYMNLCVHLSTNYMNLCAHLSTNYMTTCVYTYEIIFAATQVHCRGTGAEGKLAIVRVQLVVYTDA